jgi:hypothetical protein
MEKNGPCYELFKKYEISVSCEFNGVTYSNCVDSSISIFQRTGAGLRKYGGNLYRIEISRLKEMEKEGFKSIVLYSDKGTILYASSIVSEIQDLEIKSKTADKYYQQKLESHAQRRLQRDYDDWFDENQTYDPLKGY